MAMPSIHTVLWPITDGGGGKGESFFREFTDNVVLYTRLIWGEVTSGELSLQLLFFFGFWGVVVFLWVYDGTPIAREGYNWIRRTAARAT